MNYVVLQDASITYYAIDLVIVLAVIAGLRLFSGLVSNASLNEILSVHDNHAVGISLAGMLVAVSIMLMGAVSGEAGSSLAQEAFLMLAYGLFGVVLMWVTRILFDHLTLPRIAVHDEIIKGNIAAGTVDAGNLIATAIIVRAIMVWVDSGSWDGLIVVAAGYVISQAFLYLATLYRIRVYRRRHNGESLQKDLASGNVALALRFSGHRIGVALAITVASGLVTFNPEDILTSLGVWAGVALAMFLIQTLLSIAARHILLPGVDVGEEIRRDRNLAVGILEAAIYIAIGLVFVGLFG